MKKALSILLSVFLLLGCVFPAFSLAEEDTEALKQEEFARAMVWMTQGMEQDELIQVLSWDRDTISEKLKDYDEPLEYTTKEEIAEQLSMITGLGQMMLNAAQNDETGEGVMGMLGMFGALLGGLNGESTGDFSGFFSGEEPMADWQFDGIVSDLDNTFWECGDLKLESVFQDGYYKLLILDGSAELSYLCEYEEYVEDDVGYSRLIGIGTGDEEMNEVQPDHGKAVFTLNAWTGELIWQRDGEKLVFHQIIDPLDGSIWVGNGKTITMNWNGGLNYDLTIEQDPFDTWNYQCVMNEETNTLEGTGSKKKYSETVYTDAQASFAFNENRTFLTWKDDKEADAAEGLILDAVPQNLLGITWRGEHYALFIFKPDGFGRYGLHVYEDELSEEMRAEDEEDSDLTEEERIEHCYLCTYDWETRTFTAIDPTAIDFDSLTIYMEPELYTSTATFVLSDSGQILWLDDTGLSGDGVVLTREEF